MLGLFVLLPLLIILISIGYLFVDLKKPKAWLIALALGLLQFSLFIGLMLLVIWFNSDQEKLVKTINAQTVEIDQVQRLRGLALAHLAMNHNDAKQAFDQAIRFGFTAESSALKQVQAAHAALEKIQAQSTRSSPSSRRKISILRIPEETNQMLVAQIFRRLGYDAFYAPKNGAEDQTKPSNGSGDDTENGFTLEEFTFDRKIDQPGAQSEKLEPLPRANVLRIGRRVSVSDAQIAALVLLRAGIELKHLKRIKNSSSENANAIIIAFQKLYDRRRTLSTEKVLALKRIR